MRVIKYGQIIGGTYNRVSLVLNNREIKVSSVKNFDDAISWGNDTWKKLKSEIGEKELKHLRWTKPELRYYL